MTLRRIPSLALLLAAALLAGACGSDSPTGPSDPGNAPVEVTETFPPEPGTLSPNGGITHLFAVQQAGTIRVTVTSLAPDSAAVIGIALGSWNGTSCSQTIVKDDATQGTIIIGNATATGSYCVRVYDAAGSLGQAVQYQLTVQHF